MNYEEIIVTIVISVGVISTISTVITLFYRTKSEKKLGEEIEEITIVKKLDHLQIHGLTKEERDEIIRDVERIKLKRLSPKTGAYAG